MTLTPTQLGFIRGISTVALMAVLTYIGDASHLNGLVSGTLATIISSLALSFEHKLEAQNTEGKALFGTTTIKAQQ